jgi:hypothetical protein
MNPGSDPMPTDFIAIAVIATAFSVVAAILSCAGLQTRAPGN